MAANRRRAGAGSSDRSVLRGRTRSRRCVPPARARSAVQPAQRSSARAAGRPQRPVRGVSAHCTAWTLIQDCGIEQRACMNAVRSPGSSTQPFWPSSCHSSACRAADRPASVPRHRRSREGHEALRRGGGPSTGVGRAGRRAADCPAMVGCVQPLCRFGRGPSGGGVLAACAGAAGWLDERAGANGRRSRTG